MDWASWAGLRRPGLKPGPIDNKRKCQAFEGCMQKHFLRLIGFLRVSLLCRRLLDDPQASDKKKEEMGGKCPHRKVKKRRLLNPKFL